MKSNRANAARRKLLRIMPRATLEAMSGYDRPHMWTLNELIDKCAERHVFDETEVRVQLEKLLDATVMPVES